MKTVMIVSGAACVAVGLMPPHPSPLIDLISIVVGAVVIGLAFTEKS